MAAKWNRNEIECQLKRLEQCSPFVLLGRLSDHRHAALLMLLPSLLIIGAVSLYPTLYGILLSLREMQLNRPDLGTSFVGLAHYRTMLSDEVFWAALRNTTLWVAAVLGLELTLGMTSALAINRRLWGSELITVLIAIPWFLPNVVAANMWALMLDPRLGVVNDILVQLGWLTHSHAWFADPDTALLTAAVVQAWHGFPFCTLLLLAGLKGIPREIYEAAAVDGAGMIQRFWHVTLPMLRTVIVATVCLRVIELVSSPELLLVLTGGGPGQTTEVLALYAFNTAYRGFDFGYAGALSVIMLGLQMAFCYAYVRSSGVLRRR